MKEGREGRRPFLSLPHPSCTLSCLPLIFPLSFRSSQCASALFVFSAPSPVPFVSRPALHPIVLSLSVLSRPFPFLSLSLSIVSFPVVFFPVVSYAILLFPSVFFLVVSLPDVF